MTQSYTLHAWGISTPTPDWLNYVNHTNLEGRIYYILEEGAGYILNNQIHYFQKNHLYILPSECNIKFFLESQNFLHLYVDFISLGVINYNSVISFDIDTQPLIKSDIEQFLCFMKTKNLTFANKSVKAKDFYSNKERVTLIIDSLFHDINDTYPQKDAPNPIVIKVIHYIHKNFINEISVNEIADKMNVSRSHLLRIFKKATGYSLYQYIKKYRFDVALKMLEGGVSVSETAERCGFLSVSAFSNSFKKEFGYPPTKLK